WLNAEPALCLILPLTLSVPPVTVSVPLLRKTLLFAVHPTVRSPEAIVSVPPAIIVRLPETLAAELTVTLTPAPITTASVQAGTTPVLHVAGAFQLPEATAVKFRSVDDIPNVSPVA